MRNRLLLTVSALATFLSVSLHIPAIADQAAAATFAEPATPTESSAALSAPVSIGTDNFGLNVAVWDSQMNSPSTVPRIQTLGTGIQRFPNDDTWDWKTNRSRNSATQFTSWDTYNQAFSLDKWGQELEVTQNQGIYNINYGMNGQWNGGATVADVEELTRYIVAHHYPVKAMIIGSETWLDTTINLRKDQSPQRYADVAKQMAIAIHSIAPNIMVGVNISAGNNGNLTANDTAWDQTVLREDAPYIQFVTFHVYLVNNSVTDSGLLQNIATNIPKVTSTIHQVLVDNAGQYASQLQVWFTEYNPFTAPRPQTVQAVGAPAMIESMLITRALGVSQLDWWSLHGGAHKLLPNGQVEGADTHEGGVSYGTFALTGDGMAPEPAVNSPYPTGQALAQIDGLIQGGAKLQVGQTGDIFLARIDGQSASNWVIVNNGAQSHTVNLGNTTVTVPSAGFQIVSAAKTGAVAAVHTMSWPKQAFVGPENMTPAVSASQQTWPSVQAVSSATIQSNQLLTITGSHFGNEQGGGYVTFSDGGVNWGSPQNFYKLSIVKWTEHEIQFVTPSASVENGSVNLTAGSTASMQVFNSQGIASDVVKLKVRGALPAHLANKQPIAPNQLVTISGSGFGSAHARGYVQFADSGVNWGAPTNFYKLQIVRWTNNSIIFRAPADQLVNGSTCSISIVTDSGAQTGILQAQVVDS